MRKLMVIISSSLTAILVVFIVLGYVHSQTVNAQETLSINGSASAPVASSGTDTSQQVELNGVVLTIPSGWEIQSNTQNGNTVIRLIYHGPKPWTGPWIELSQVAQLVGSANSGAASVTGRDSQVRIFSAAAVSGGGGAVDYAWISSKNVMVRAGYTTPEQHQVIMQIFSSIHISN